MAKKGPIRASEFRADTPIFGRAGEHAMPSTAETACFEAGIKFGSLYHQFAGTPVSPVSADSLARAMEDAIENQPYCESVEVEILVDDLASELAGLTSDYAELTGRFMEVEMTVEYEGTRVRTRMEMEDDYPTMRLVSVED